MKGLDRPDTEYFWHFRVSRRQDVTEQHNHPLMILSELVALVSGNTFHKYIRFQKVYVQANLLSLYRHISDTYVNHGREKEYKTKWHRPQMQKMAQRREGADT